MFLRLCYCDLLTLIQISQGVVYLALLASHTLCSDRVRELHRLQVPDITLNAIEQEKSLKYQVIWPKH